jgi:hypothetical protein
LPWNVRAARGSPFITKAAKGVKLTKQDSLIRAFGHERRRNKARPWRRPRIGQTFCFVSFTPFATFVIKALPRAAGIVRDQARPAVTPARHSTHAVRAIPVL